VARPTYVDIDTSALLHNINQVKQRTTGQHIIAMVKANAYGCGIQRVVPAIKGEVDALGVASLEEALAIRALGVQTPCILFQGLFSAEELIKVTEHHLQCVIHQPQQLHWIVNTPLSRKIKVWVKVNTGMGRLGLNPTTVFDAICALKACPWVDDEIGLMTHLACADEPSHPSIQAQLGAFSQLTLPPGHYNKSIANSAAILALRETHADVVRPGIMLYGVSPFSQQTGFDLGLKPIMSFRSAISAIHNYPANTSIGYGAIWKTTRLSTIAIVPVGYGDGYPRHITPNTYVWVNDHFAPIVGRVSMDMLTIDVTDIPTVEIGSPVELWGKHIAVEKIAQQSGTIAYELLCQISPRARGS
jgi:alanine racemase